MHDNRILVIRPLSKSKLPMAVGSAHAIKPDTIFCRPDKCLAIIVQQELREHSVVSTIEGCGTQSPCNCRVHMLGSVTVSPESTCGSPHDKRPGKMGARIVLLRCLYVEPDGSGVLTLPDAKLVENKPADHVPCSILDTARSAGVKSAHSATHEQWESHSSPAAGNGFQIVCSCERLLFADSGAYQHKENSLAC